MTGSPPLLRLLLRHRGGILGNAAALRRGCFTNQRHWCQATTAWRATANGRVRSAPEGLRRTRVIDLSWRRPALLALDHKQFPVRHLCETASVRSGSDRPSDRSLCRRERRAEQHGGESPGRAGEYRIRARRPHKGGFAASGRRAQEVIGVLCGTGRECVMPDRRHRLARRRSQRTRGHWRQPAG